MLYHWVLFKIPANTSSEKIKNFYNGLETLTRIDGVVSIQCGAADKMCFPGYQDRSKGYTHALMVILKNKAALEKYEKDAYHVLIKSTIIVPLIDTTADNPIMAVDFEGVLAEKKPFYCSHWTLAAAVALVAGFAFVKLRARFH